MINYTFPINSYQDHYCLLFNLYIYYEYKYTKLNFHKIPKRKSSLRHSLRELKIHFNIYLKSLRTLYLKWSSVLISFARTTVPLSSIYASLDFTNRAHVSTCGVFGNMSFALTFSILYPFSISTCRSVTNVFGLHDT